MVLRRHIDNDLCAQSENAVKQETKLHSAESGGISVHLWFVLYCTNQRVHEHYGK